jgi:AcrR family transcriptional regulator
MSPHCTQEGDPLLVTEINEALPGGSSLLRNEPVQARSSARLTGLLDAAAAIIDEIGFERLTTAMVAERAGASIGTVYRYFPDRIAVVEALAVRCVQRLSDSIDVAVAAADITEWRDAIDIAIDRMVAMYLAEPGFRSVRFGDMETGDRAVDASAGETPDETRATLADLITGLLTTRFELEARRSIRRGMPHRREGLPRPGRRFYALTMVFIGFRDALWRSSDADERTVVQ